MCLYPGVDSPVTRRIVEDIQRQGPIRFDRFMEVALYDPDAGFFAEGHGAGRAGSDFITSPEVGSLFGALVATALDQWWERLGRPDPYVIVDAGAGRGQLARDVLRAKPACAPALRYVMVERSAALRRLQHEHLQVEPPEDALGPAVRRGPDDDDPEPVPGTGPIVTQTETLPAVRFVGVVLANELLDNLPFRIVERGSDGWLEMRVGVEDSGAFTEMLVPAEPPLSDSAEGLVPDAAVGTRLPIQDEVGAWLAECGAVLRRGFVVVVDYAAAAAVLAQRGPTGWLRTYRAHDRGGPATDAPGTQDITTDVVLETLRAGAAREGFKVVAEQSQAEWLGELGIAGLVEDGRTLWEDRAHLGDLEALKGRSRVSEGAALTHPDGLGAHRVIILSKGV